MSQASKHVEWCINKAQKEIEECKKLGKRAKHRGLLQSEPNLEEAQKHLAKAEHNLSGISMCIARSCVRVNELMASNTVCSRTRN